MHVAFFGHDISDAAVRRRARSFLDDGLDLTGFMMRRREPGELDWQVIDLGETRDGAFLQRVWRIFTGARRAAKAREVLAKADLIYARNLDMLACAFLTKKLTGLKTPVVYESLDVHRLLCRSDLIGKTLRALEGALLRRSAGLIVSSPAFLKHHFDKYYEGQFQAALVENRLANAFTGEARPEVPSSNSKGPLKIGWVGMLRCSRTLSLLSDIADQLGEQVEVRIHGIPVEREVPQFQDVIQARSNMHFFGRYKAPEDLSEIYDQLDLVWAGDFMEAGLNSVWLLPNRLYEGGFYGVPAIAPQGTQTAAWIQERECGFVVEEPLEESLPELLKGLRDNRLQLSVKRDALLSLPLETFVQPRGYMRTVLTGFLAGSDVSVSPRTAPSAT